MLCLRLPALLVFLIGALVAQGQTYFNDVARGIPNDGAWHQFEIPVTSALNPQLSANYGLNRVCMVVHHPEVSHLTIKLGTPASGEIILADLDGTRGANFTNTCFSMRAPRSIANGSAPFTGTFISKDYFSMVNRDFLQANGPWYLAIRNTSPTDTGTFRGVSITLENGPAPDPAFVPLCGVQNAGDCHCPDGSDTCDLLPDMSVSAQIISDQNEIDGDSLRFSNATPNIGWGPLEVHGTAQCYCDTTRAPCATLCPNGQPPRERVIQRIYRKQGLSMTTRDRDMGYMQYHPSHGHVHVEGWSIYTLRVRNQSPDPRQWPIVATSGKRSYCLVNFGDCDGRFGYCVDDTGGVLTHAQMPNYGLGVVTATTCGRDQGIFVGSLDIYATNTPGQAMSIRGLCTGDYYIVSETDPDQMVEEMSHANNVAAVPIRITRPAQGVVPIFDIASNGPSITFAASNLPTGAQFVWVFGDGVRDSTNNPAVHLYNQPGRYTVRLIYKGQGCGNTSTTQVIAIAAVAPVLSAASFGLRVQPNPATAGSVIAFNLPSGAGGRLFVANALGQTVQRYEPSIMKMGANAVPLGLSLPRGLYTAVLETSRGRAAVKFGVE